MKKSQLKEIIKPIVKECVNEILLTEGLLSTIIAEVSLGVTRGERILEVSREDIAAPTPQRDQEHKKTQEKRLKEARKRMLDSIGVDAYNGVNVFEGTTPLKSAGVPNEGPSSNPLSEMDPKDPGVDINRIFGPGMTQSWGKIVKG